MNAEPSPDRGESINMDSPNATTSAPVSAVMAGHGHRPVTAGMATMQAVVQDRYGSADVLELADIDQPVPAGNEVLMQVQAAGLHRGDWHVMTGLPYLIRIVVAALGLRKPKSPVLGMDVAGRVEAVGCKVTRFQPGDEVFGWCDRSFAEYASAPEDQLAAKPANLSFEQAAAVPISGFAALQALRTWARSKRALTPKGTLVIVGGEGGGRWMGGFLRNLRAPVLSRFTGQRLRMLASRENQEDLQTLGELLEAGKLTPRIGRTYPLGEVRQAMRALEAGNTRGKIVITV